MTRVRKVLLGLSLVWFGWTLWSAHFNIIGANDELNAQDAFSSRLVSAVGDELRRGLARARDHDLFAFLRPAKQMREQVPRVVGVVLG